MTSDHSGHEFKDIIAEVNQKRDLLVEELKELRTKSLPEWEERHQQVMRFRKSFHKDIDEVEKAMEDRAEELRKSIDVALFRNKESLKVMKAPGERTLEGQAMILSEEIEEIKKRTQTLETLLANSDLTRILHEQVENVNRVAPFVHSLDAPRLIETQIDIRVLQGLIGNLTNTEKERSFGFSTGACHQELCPMNISEKRVGRNRRPMSLMESPSMISRIQTFHSYPYIVCVGNNEALIALDNDNAITRINMEGYFKDTIILPLCGDFTRYKHMSLTTAGAIVCCEGKAVSLLTKNKIGYVRKCTLFETEENPFRLCCLHNGDILALLLRSSKIVHYNQENKSTRTLDSSLFWSLHPHAIAINKVNQDMYISDQGEPKKVVALDHNYKLRYVYTGPDEGPFYPMEICTDNMGNVLIIDLDHRVYVLDNDCNFIRYLLPNGIGRWNTIDVDNDGNVWIGEEGPATWETEEGFINVYKYLE